jgi:hypothetical protein
MSGSRQKTRRQPTRSPQARDGFASMANPRKTEASGIFALARKLIPAILDRPMKRHSPYLPHRVGIPMFGE